MTRLMTVALAVAFFGYLGGCADESRVVEPPTELPAPGDTSTDTNRVTVSEAMPIDIAASSARLGTPGQAAFSSVTTTSAAETDIAFVSLRPGTVPGGIVAVIRTPRSEGTVTVAVTDGGFDPVPVPAIADDTVEIEVSLAGSTDPARIIRKVPAGRPPRVVRTVPPRGKTDVAVNAVIVVVFTEPIATATLSTSTVQLRVGQTAVPGTVRPLQGGPTSVLFVPTTALTANTEYSLVVTQGIRDAQGEALDGGVTTMFRTGTRREGPVSFVRVLPDSADIAVGSQAQFAALPMDSLGILLAGRPVIWRSSDNSVARISATGLVTAVAPGGVSITATVEGQVGYALLRVSASLPPVTSIKLTPDSARIPIDGTLHLFAEHSGGGEQPVLSWSSSNPAVASVTPNTSRTALVTGHANGTAYITVAVDGVSDVSRIDVGHSGAIVGITISPDPATVVMGSSTQLTAYSRDENGGLLPIPTSQVTWGSSNTAVAGVNSVGQVTGNAAGSATITANWSAYSVSVSVTVVALSFAQISSGFAHSCGVTPSGAAFCWGSDWEGALCNCIWTGTPGGSPVPTPVAGGHTFATVDVAWNHTCGLTTDGAVYCWGLNATGEDRCLNGKCSVSPTRAGGGLTFTALSVGAGKTCALASNGTAYCWAIYDWGVAPTPVSGGLTFASIAPSVSHTCALTRDGAAYCWGSNDLGQLGVASSELCADTPCAVDTELRFATIITGEGHTCALTASGAAHCWGASSYYGRGGNSKPVPVMSAYAFVALSGKYGHVCGLLSDGTGHCWDDWGIAATRPPWKLPGDIPFAKLSVNLVSCGLTADHVGYCWGQNNYGQTGTGATSDHVSVPTKVFGQP